MTHLEIATAALLILGTGFCALAALGVLRFSDVFLRIHAASKASTLGMILLAAATALRFGTLPEGHPLVAKCLLIILFLFLTAPISAHLIARAAKMRKNAMSKRTSAVEWTD